MESFRLLEDLEFHAEAPYAQPLLVNSAARILRWTLQPGQQVREHAAPGSPFYVVILKGRGAFAGPDGREEIVSVGTLLLFGPGESHSVRALDEQLVFIGFLEGVESMRPDRTGGALHHE